MGHYIEGIAIGASVAAVFLYMMWRQRTQDSDWKYLILATIGLAMLLGAFLLKQMPQPFESLAYVIGIVGWVLGLVFGYKYWKSSGARKHRRKKGG